MATKLKKEGKKTDLQRFNGMTAKGKGKNSCHIFSSRGTNGYGVFKVNGVSFLAHRWIFERKSGKKIQEGKELLHSCNEPSCVRFSHLRVGTRAENMAQAARQGRMTPKPHWKPRTRISPAEMVAILDRHSKNESSYAIALSMNPPREPQVISRAIRAAKAKPIKAMMKILKPQTDYILSHKAGLIHIPHRPYRDPWNTFEPCKQEWEAFSEECLAVFGKVA